MAKDKTNYFSFWNVLYLLLIAGAMVPGFLLVPYGMYFADEPYQIMNTMDIYRSPMAPLTSWTGGILGGLTDFRWIIFRYLAVTLNYLAIIVSGTYLYRRVRSFKITAITISAAIFLSGLSRDYQNIFGWDCWTSLFTSILIICILELIHKPDFLRLLIASAVAALTISFRIPNGAVVIPVVWLILLLTTMRRCRMEKEMPKPYPWLYVLFTGIFLVIIIWGLYGSPIVYMDSLRENMLSEHSAYYLLEVILFDIARDGFSILAFGMLVMILEGVRRGRSAMKSQPLGKLTVSCASLGAIGFLCLVLIFNPVTVNVKWYDVDWVLLALCFAIWQYFRRGDTDGLVCTVTVLLMGCVCFVGSNMGFVKYPGYILIPFTTALLLPLCDIKKMKYYMLIAGIPFVVMDFYTIWNKSFMEQGLPELDTCVTHGRAKGLYSTARSVRIVESVEKLKKETSPESTKFVVGEGLSRFVYAYLLDCTDSYRRHDWTWDAVLDSPEYVEWLQRRLENTDNAVVVYIYRTSDNPPTKVKEFLDCTMSPSAEYESYAVYVK